MAETTSNQTFTSSISFCRTRLWSKDVLTGNAPSFTKCFQDTVLVYIPYGWLLMTAPFYVVFLRRRNPEFPLPLTSISILKSVLCIVLAVMVCSEFMIQLFDHEIPISGYVAFLIRFTLFVLTAAIIQFVRVKHINSSGILYTFWILLLLCSTIPLQSKISYEPTNPSSVVFYIHYAILVVQVVCHSYADRINKSDYSTLNQENSCPDSEASIPSKLFFSWITEIVIAGFKSKLDDSDIWEQSLSLKSKNCVPVLEKEWKKEIEKSKRTEKLDLPVDFKHQAIYNGYINHEQTPLLEMSSSGNHSHPGAHIKRKPSLFRVLFKTYWLEFLFYSFLKVINDGFILTQPLLLSYMISYIDETKKSSNLSNDWRGVSLPILFFIAGIGATIFQSQNFFKMSALGLKIKVSIIGLLYQKVFTINNASKAKYSAGEIVNLMSVDCQRIQDAFLCMYDLVSFFLAMGIGIYLMWMEMGVSSMVTQGIIIVMTILNVLFGKLQQIYQSRILSFKSSRISCLGEILNGIKILKMYTWEKFFTDKIIGIRDKEEKFMKKLATVTSFSVLLSNHSGFFLNFVILVTYFAISKSAYLSAQNVFVVLSTINILRFPLMNIPYTVASASQLYVSVGRIQDFLLNEDLKKYCSTSREYADTPISIRNGCFKWSANTEGLALKNIDIGIPKKSFVAVVGSVGSGKTSLISAILGELEKISGEIDIKGSIAYVPQEAWIQNMSLRENILFGHTYNNRKYKKVLQACALNPDLQLLPAGDETEIGEKGTNLSGGQRQRLSLARAVYSNSDIYILDDPLSAVDINIGKQIFEKVIGHQGLLKNKTRVMVTLGFHWLPMVDTIIVMDNGRIREIGSFKKLLKAKGAFANLLETYLQETLTDTETEDEFIKEHLYEKVLSGLSDYNITSDDEKRYHRLERSTVQMGGCSIYKPESVLDTCARNRHLISDENVEVGSIKWSVLWTYIRSIGLPVVFVSYLSQSLNHGLNIYGNFILTFWTEDPLLKNISLSDTQEYQDRNVYYLTIYSILGFLQGIFILIFAMSGLRGLVNASVSMHSKMTTRIMRAPARFFDTTPIGRILNRFASDLDVLDNRMPLSLRVWSSMIFTLLSILVVLTIKTPIFASVGLPVAGVYYLIIRCILPTMRQLRRLESASRSSVYNHFSETVSGITSIRAYKADERFTKTLQERVDKNSAISYAAMASLGWLNVRLGILGNTIVFFSALFAILSNDLTGADIGLTVTYSMQVIDTLFYLVQSFTEMEMNIVSVERTLEYTNIESEAQWQTSYQPLPEWPQKGSIEFRNFKTRYRPELELVLRGINCKMHGGEKVGIVGRTGAGKSSLTLSLFRLIEATEGGIVIDGVHTADLGLHQLRSKLTILPQDPLLFSGTLKMNLDPQSKFSDDQVWQALERTHMKEFVTKQVGQLCMEVGEGGSYMSVGQRQLVCLARTLLHKNKILILDEATANVDMRTDDLIQETIRNEFSDCTILTIAHRVNTVMEYDRIMVLDNGLLVQFDAPQTLLLDKDGMFFKMAVDAKLIRQNNDKFTSLSSVL